MDNFIKHYQIGDFVKKLIKAWQFCKLASIHFYLVLRYCTYTPRVLTIYNETCLALK